MKSMEITDEWLYQYMPVVDNAMIKALESQVNEDYVFSKHFERKMQKVIRLEAHPVLSGAQQILKSVAIFFTGIICAGLVLTLSVDAYRDKFFMTLKTLREDATQYNYSSGEKDVVLTPTIPTYIPEGYTETNRIDTPLYSCSCPSTMRTMRFADWATPRSWVIMTMVLPISFNSRNSFNTSLPLV